MTPEPPGRLEGGLFSADGWAAFIAATVSRLYLGVLLSLAVIAVLPALLGWQASVVRSGSMEPHISIGDVVVAAGFDRSDPVPVGGVVRFTSPAEAEPDGRAKARLHRIVGVNDDGTFTTAGDANADVDSTPLERKQITGQARLLVPYIGLPGLWLSNGNLTALALWSVVTVLAVAATVYASRPTAIALGRNASPPIPVDSAGGRGGGPAAVSSPAAADSPTATALPPANRRVSMRRLRTVVTVVLVLALCVLVVLGASGFTSAAFTSTTANAGNSFRAAADWAPPKVSMTDPGTPVKDAITLTATASDAESGIRDVAIQYLRSDGSSWTTVCTRSTPPYSCSWNTKTVTDGSYTLRATATDNAAHAATSATVETVVANSLVVVLTNPGEIQRGTVNLQTTLYSPGTSLYSVRVEYSVAGANNWKTLCAAVLAPYNCSWVTTAFANDYYDLRAVAVAGTTSTFSAPVTDVLVDNQAPTVTMTDPGTPLSGTVPFAATAADAHSGIAQVALQYSQAGTGPWTNLCTVTAVPYSCRFDTTTLPDGSYSFRAIATDAGGLSTTSATVANRTVNNTISSVSLQDPGEYLTGMVALAAAANSTAGVASVGIQYAPAGTTTWTTACTVTTTPYTCTWDTRTLADGLYDFRAVLTDTAARETISATVAARRVDNSPLRGTDIQTANGSAIAGRLGTGDAMTFTYSQQVNPATVSPGWSGSALAVTVRLRDGNLVALGNNGDTIDIQRQSSTVNLGTVNLSQNYAKPRKTVVYNATMVATTTAINGVPRTVITVTLGSVATGANGLRTVTAPSTMVWTPTATVTNLTGTPSSRAPVNEPGAVDREF
ncbi:signal peptidase I [Microbacterium sp. LWH3-1.2]|uniref:signal peptidase I n=1 Tax=Microbacterium sp. LWH3-1.2 TaxID=3135256 RepID=UPI0034138612